MPDKDERRQATIETIMRRNNSISVVKRHAIPYSHLHKKTYFNALEKILISPKNLKKSVNHAMTAADSDPVSLVPGLGGQDTPNMTTESYMVTDSMNRAFDDVFKKPPSRLGDEQPPRRAKK